MFLLQEIKKTLKSYQAEFDDIDDEIEGDVERRRRKLRSEWNKYRAAKAALHASRLPKLKAMRPQLSESVETEQVRETLLSTTVVVLDRLDG